MIATGIVLFALGWIYSRLRGREHQALVALNSSFGDWWDAAAGICILLGVVFLLIGTATSAWRLLP